MEHQRGATLIEVLITLLILKLGLLAVLASQLMALKVVTDASQRTTAIALSQEITQQLTAFNSKAASSDFSSNNTFPVFSCSAAAPCNYAEVRRDLLSRWQQKWQASEMGYGLLYAAEFCVQQQSGRIELQASWRQSAAQVAASAKVCAVTDGRSGFQL